MWLDGIQWSREVAPSQQEGKRGCACAGELSCPREGSSGSVRWGQLATGLLTHSLNRWPDYARPGSNTGCPTWP